MKKTSDIFDGELDRSSSPETFSNPLLDSSQIKGHRLAETYEDDLAKNQWIVFAVVAVFLLLTAAGVSAFGELALRFTEPTETPTAVSKLLTVPVSISPTATLMPSPTYVVPTPVPLVLKVLPNSANLRSAPNLTARVVGQLKRSSSVTPLAQSLDGRWFLVVSPENGITGWVANELFERVSGDPALLPITGPGSQ